jgi:hypothetical protein
VGNFAVNLIVSFMSNFADAYEITGQLTENGIDFFFMSLGKRDVVKIIRYSYVMNFQGKELYNLAFGDYDYRTGSYTDDLASGNGDPYGVYHTVLATIPYFFHAHDDAMLMVRGSDSTWRFQNKCRMTCKRKCVFPKCKRAYRRINIYRSYLDKNFDSLTEEYDFWGDPGTHENQILAEPYIQGEKYIAIFIKKRKFII